MITSAFVLILSILLLGGVIATVGDRIGTKVGKARLSLFNLRPRNTAVLITILTGITVSASTLGILFASSKPLRQGVFELDEIQERLKKAKKELAKATEQKSQIESELVKVVAQKSQTDQELAKAVAQKSQTEQELAKAVAQKNQTEIAFAKVRAQQAATQEKALTEQAAAQKRLDAINESLKAVRSRQSQTQSQLNATQTQLNQATANFQQASSRLKNVTQQAGQLRSDIQTLLAEREELIQQRNEVKVQISQRDEAIAQQDKVLAEREDAILKRDKALAELDDEISQRDEVIAQREGRLKELEKQQVSLAQEIATLEQYYQSYQVLRQGNVALRRGQVLAFGVFRILDPAAARQVVDQLLSEANRNALQATGRVNSQVNERAVEITQAQVEQLLNQVKDGREYVVRIFSAGNYVVGEKKVRVFADAALNEVVFSAGDVVATASADPSTMNDEQLRQRIDMLLIGSQFRASRAGVMGDTIQIGDGRITTLIHFVDQLKEYKQPVNIQAVVVEDTHISGPMKVKLVVMKNGEVVFST